MRQPTKVVRQFSTFGELWYDENPHQIEAQRLEQAGIIPEVFLDSFGQVLLSDVEWSRNTKILGLVDTWMMDSFLRWKTRLQIAQYLVGELR